MLYSPLERTSSPLSKTIMGRFLEKMNPTNTPHP